MACPHDQLVAIIRDSSAQRLSGAFFLAEAPGLLRLFALLALIGSGALTYFAASQFMQAMTVSELHAMIRRQA